VAGIQVPFLTSSFWGPKNGPHVRRPCCKRGTRACRLISLLAGQGRLGGRLNVRSRGRCVQRAKEKPAAAAEDRARGPARCTFVQVCPNRECIAWTSSRPSARTSRSMVRNWAYPPPNGEPSFFILRFRPFGLFLAILSTFLRKAYCFAVVIITNRFQCSDYQPKRPIFREDLAISRNSGWKSQEEACQTISLSFLEREAGGLFGGPSSLGDRRRLAQEISKSVSSHDKCFVQVGGSGCSVFKSNDGSERRNSHSEDLASILLLRLSVSNPTSIPEF